MKRSQLLTMFGCVLLLIALSFYSFATLQFSSDRSFPKLHPLHAAQPPIGSPFFLGLANPFIVAQPAPPPPQGVVTPVYGGVVESAVTAQQRQPIVIVIVAPPQPSPIPPPQPGPLPSPQPGPIPPPLPGPPPPPIPQVVNTICNLQLPTLLSPIQHGACGILKV